jgi:hypothetical protein
MPKETGPALCPTRASVRARARRLCARAPIGRTHSCWCNVWVELTCAASTSGNAAWPSAVAGSPPTLVTGTCNTGYYVPAGAPYRGCDITGTLTAIENACLRRRCAHMRLCIHRHAY